MEASGGTSPMESGPWGGGGGARWDDGAYGYVRQVIISHGAWVDSVQIEYGTNDNRASAVWSERHGGWGGARTDKVKLDHPDEYLVSVSGYYGPASDRGAGTAVVVRCLELESNKRRFGPFGSQSGTRFSFSLTAGAKIVGFHGRSGNQLDSIGVHIKPFVTVVPTQARNRGFVRGGRENMVNGGFGGLELKDKLFTGEGNPYYRQVETQNENYTYMTNSGYGEPDQTFDAHSALLSYKFPTRGPFPNAIQQKREIGDYNMAPNYDLALGGYEKNKEKTYDTIGAENGYPNMRQTTEDLYNTRQEGYSNNNTSAQNSKVTPKQAVSYGPWGGSGGMLFNDGVYTGVREIHLSRSSAVVSIKVCYDINGQVVWSNKNGGTSAFRFDKITLDYPNEVLTRISGYYGSTGFRGPVVIKSLTFFTNKNKYGPFGDEQGVPFSSTQNEGVIVGFHGKKGLFLDSIGVHFLYGKRPSFDTNSTTSSTDIKFSDQRVLYGPTKGPNLYGPRPLVGSDGSPWDDGVYTGIRKIFLTKGESIIYAIQIEYDLNGQSIWSIKHGNNNNNEGSCHVIQFEYPQEVVTSISGHYGSIGEDGFKQVVKSLTLHTNRRKYGPYGEEIGTYFTSSNSDLQTKIVGFHGNSGTYLYSIGVHTQQQQCLNDRVDQLTGSLQNASPQHFRLINHF